MMFSWEEIQQAFIDGDITFDELFEILKDNFGFKNAKKIIDQNLSIALKDIP